MAGWLVGLQHHVCIKKQPVIVLAQPPPPPWRDQTPQGRAVKNGGLGRGRPGDLGAGRQEPGAVPRSAGRRPRPTLATQAVFLSIPQKRVPQHCGAPHSLHDGVNQEAYYARTVTCERQDSARMRALLRVRSGRLGLLWKGWDPAPSCVTASAPRVVSDRAVRSSRCCAHSTQGEVFTPLSPGGRRGVPQFRHLSGVQSEVRPAPSEGGRVPSRY